MFKAECDLLDKCLLQYRSLLSFYTWTIVHRNSRAQTHVNTHRNISDSVIACARSSRGFTGGGLSLSAMIYNLRVLLLFLQR